jgi:hypothetical protein
MSERQDQTFEGDADWETPDRHGAMHIVCKIGPLNNIDLEIMWNKWKYLAWLDHSDGGNYAGVYEVRRGISIIRGKATCFLKQADGMVELKGILREDCRDRKWQGRLREVTVSAVCSEEACSVTV